MAGTLDDLAALLRRLDGRGYAAYNDARSTWTTPHGWTLHVERVQRDPFAPPSVARITIAPDRHGIPEQDRSGPRRGGAQAYLLEAFRAACGRLPRRGGSGGSGRIDVPRGAPTVLPRAGCRLDAAGLEMRFRVGLPATGRRILGHKAAQILTSDLSQAVTALLDHDAHQRTRWADAAEDHHALQTALTQQGLAAFVADGSILPRASGISQDPLPDAHPFTSPPSLRVRLDTPNSGTLTGMGIPDGVTVVTGGGFHGKTTLLEAIQAGIHPHTPGDGRERIATRSDAVKVRSEDGRCVAGVDLSAFVHGLPRNAPTHDFHTQDASGSTSLAAAIMEALEAGTTLLLLDEDTSSTNLLVRDARMQELVPHEPLTPLIDHARSLADAGTSLLLVTGGSGDYLDVADTVLRMDAYQCQDATKEAKEVARRHPTSRGVGDPDHPLRVRHRTIDPQSLDPRVKGKAKMKGRGTHAMRFGPEEIEVRFVEQFVDAGQVQAAARLLWRMADTDGDTLQERAHAALQAIGDDPWNLDTTPELALPRLQELMAAASRHRGLRAEAAK